MNMNIFLILIVSIKLAQSGPIDPIAPTVTVYDKILELAKHDEYKCPYLRQMLQTNLKPAFLQVCHNFVEEMNMTKIDDTNEPQFLCMLYYKNFKDLCRVSEKADLALQKASIKEGGIDKNDDIKTICQNIDRYSNKTDNPDEPITKPLYKLFSDPKKCEKVCTGLDEKVKDPCALSSHMAFAANQIKMKRDATKNKPAITNSVADVGSNENRPVQPNYVAPIQAVPHVEAANVNDVKVPTEIETENPTESAGPAIGNVYSAEGLDAADKSNEAKVNVQNQPIASPNQNPRQEVQTEIVATEKINKDGAKPLVNAEETQSQADSKPQSALPKDQNSGINTQQQAPQVALTEKNQQPIDIVASPEKPADKSGKPSSVEDLPGSSIPIETNNRIKIEETIPKKEAPADANPEYAEDEDEEEYSISETVEKSKVAEKSKPRETDEDGINFSATYPNQSMTEDDSYFFSYFMMVCIVFILGYVGYHNKQKLLALVLEGRKGRRQQRRRPNSANYHKLDSNLEEAVTSSCNKNTTNVIY